MNAARASFSPPPKPAHLRPYPAPSTANPQNPVAHHNGGGDHEATRGGRPQRLSPQEAALRGASLAFQKQKEQSAGAANSDNHNHHNNNARVSRQTTGSSTVSAWEAVEQRERERERQALFLSPSSASYATTRDAHMGHGVAAPQTGKETDGTTATAPPSARLSASFIAATLAVSRSNTPVHSDTATPAAGDGGSGNGGGIGGGGMSRVPTLREPAEAQRRVRGRRGSSAVTSPTHSSEDLTDTTSLAPAISLISMFEHKGDAEKMEPRKRASRPGSPEKPRPRSAYAVVNRDGGTGDYAAQEIGSSSTTSRPKPSPKPKPKPRTKTQVREQTPSPPPVRRASLSIVSPKPRRPDTLSRWDSTAQYDEDIESSNVTPKATIKPKQAPKVPRPRGTASRRDEGQLEKPLHTMAEENRKVEQQPPKLPNRIPSAHIKERPPAPRKSAELSRRVPLSPKVKDPRIHDVAYTDGQQESTLMATENIPDARPSTADSKSSNDSFVSASSVPTRDGTDSLHTVGRSTPSSTTPRPVISRPRSAQPPLVAPPIRRSVTGSSQLPLESLSDAIMAGSLASARHTPVSAAEGRALPPAPPPRRQAQRRMKHTLRQPKALSDDEDARRPHHRKGLNNKKHAHHEGSRRRWREEITERERKRYEAVWASNRGLFLVQPQQQHQQQQSQSSSSLDVNQRPQLATQQNCGQPVRNESYEELSECVANVVVRDIWTRSRLPPAELAEVWDLVYGYGRTPVYATLSKQEFVVGMWLIDQRLRGRKIPPRVSESVWGSAKGVRVLSPGKAEKHHHHHHHHYHPHRPGHNKVKGK